jgi:hypothetical protein
MKASMRSKPAVIAACLIFAMPALSLAADTPFPAIIPSSIPSRA